MNGTSIGNIIASLMKMTQSSLASNLLQPKKSLAPATESAIETLIIACTLLIILKETLEPNTTFEENKTRV